MRQIGRGAGIGLAGGVTIASLLALLHEMNLNKRRKQMNKVPSETDEDTIVLTLPQKQGAVIQKYAEVLGTPSVEPVGIGKTQTVSSSTKRVPSKSYRSSYGSSSMKVAYPWDRAFKDSKTPDLATYILRALAIPAAGVAGYGIVDKLHSNSIQKRLKKEEEASRQEMLDMLTGQGKVAEWVTDFSDLPLTKEAQNVLTDRGQRILNAVGGPAAMLAILGTGGVAWLTKKMLDSKAKERDSAGWDPPDVRRIVFKSAPVASPQDLEPEEKMATAADVESIQATLIVMMDKLGGNTRALAEPAVKLAMADAGITVHQMYKMAQAPSPMANDTNVNAIMEFFGRNPELRQKVIRSGIQNYKPLQKLRWDKNYFMQDLMNKPWMQGINKWLFGMTNGFGQVRKTLSDPAVVAKLQKMLPEGVTIADLANSKDPMIQKLLAKQIGNYTKGPGMLQNAGDWAKRVTGNQPGFDLKPFMKQYGPLIAGLGGTAAIRGLGGKGFASFLPAMLGAGGTAAMTYPKWGPAAAEGIESIKEKAPGMLGMKTGVAASTAVAGGALIGGVWGTIDAVRNALQRQKKQQLLAAGLGAAGLGTLAATGVGGYALGRRKGRKEKEAGLLPSMSGVVSSYLGSEMAEKTGPSGTEGAEKPWEQIPTKGQLRKLMGQVKLQANDPNAEEYLKENRGKIRAVLMQMLSEGQLQTV